MDRLKDRRLVRALMKAKGLKMISITATAVLVQVNERFTPEQADELCRSVGQEGARRVTDKGNNFILFARF